MAFSRIAPKTLVPTFIGLLLLAAEAAPASDLKDARPVSDRIVMLHFLDGHIDYHGLGELPKDDVIHNDPLVVDKAHQPSAYTIVSSDDDDFSSGVTPKLVGVKGKPWGVSGKWPKYPHVMAYWVYLGLGKSMTSGKTYTVKWSSRDLNTNVDSAKIDFDSVRTRSVAVHVNQVGFVPNLAKKYAYVSQFMGIGSDAKPMRLDIDHLEGAKFHVVDAKDRQKILFTGRISKRRDFETEKPTERDFKRYGLPHDDAIGSDVWECDFTSLNEPGEYVIAVEGLGTSYPFEIRKDVYNEVARLTTRSLFYQRAGIAKEEPYAEGWPFPRDHYPGDKDGYDILYTKLRWIDLWDGKKKIKEQSYSKAKKLVAGPIETWGWYHDAADWDGYTRHYTVPLYLLTAYELQPCKYKDGDLNIPESGNGLPDILDEARWLVDYYRRTRDAAERAGYSTGGIPGGRVHPYRMENDDKTHAQQGSSIADDTRDWLVHAEDPLTTYLFVGQALHLAHCLDLAAGEQAAESKKLLQEAIDAYEWAQKNTTERDLKIVDHGSHVVKDARRFAAAWLYKYTGDRKYEKQFDEYFHDKSAPVKFNAIDTKICMWAVFAYATCKQPDMNEELRNEILNKYLFVWADDNALEPGRNRAFRFGIAYSAPALNGSSSTPHVIETVIAYELTKEQKYLDVISATCDYMLGGNGVNMTWVSGYGDQQPRQVCHLNSRYAPYHDKKEFPTIPGLVPYGVHHAEDFSASSANDPDFNITRLYPQKTYRYWPLHELYCENRYNYRGGGEFTINQNLAPAAFHYNYMRAPTRTSK